MPGNFSELSVSSVSVSVLKIMESNNWNVAMKGQRPFRKNRV